MATVFIGHLAFPTLKLCWRTARSYNGTVCKLGVGGDICPRCQGGGFYLCKSISEEGQLTASFRMASNRGRDTSFRGLPIRHSLSYQCPLNLLSSPVFVAKSSCCQSCLRFPPSPPLTLSNFLHLHFSMLISIK